MSLPSQGDPPVPANQSKRSVRKRAWRAYSWYNRFHRLYAFLFHAKVAATISTMAVAGVAVVGVAAVVKPQMLGNWFAPANKVEVSTQQWAGSSVVFSVDGVDKAGKKASFDVVVATKDYTWPRASTDQLARGGAVLTASDLATQLFTPDVRAGLSHSGKVIAVGVASQEGDVVAETARAEQRARSAATWISTAVNASTGILLLNLGQYKGSCSSANTPDTSWERPFIMIGVRAEEPGVDLSQALANAMSGKSNLPSADCYSRFDLTSQR